MLLELADTRIRTTVSRNAESAVQRIHLGTRPTWEVTRHGLHFILRAIAGSLGGILTYRHIKKAMITMASRQHVRHVGLIRTVAYL